jgi:hypothetical protein
MLGRKWRWDMYACGRLSLNFGVTESLQVGMQPNGQANQYSVLYKYGCTLIIPQHASRGSLHGAKCQ